MSETLEAVPGLPAGDAGVDADAFMRYLYRRYATALYGYIERFSPDLAGTDDFVQETFIRAWRNRERLCANEQMIRPWLFTVARHLLIDAARAARVRPVTVEARPDLDVSGDDELDQVMDRQLLADALQQLSPAHRAVLVETFYRGGSTAVVARQLGVPHGTARSRLHYALLALREQLRDLDRPQSGAAAA